MDSGMDSTRSLGDWTVSEWLNTAQPDYSVDELSGRVVLAAAFQMLCPGCVDQTIPQLKRAAALFPEEHLAVVGLHTVFEHHEAMTPVALRAFVHEYRIRFPVAIDAAAPDGGPVPVTMNRFSLQGTPTMLVFDRSGLLRRQSFGHLSDMQLGAEIAQLIGDPAPARAATAVPAAEVSGCDDSGCRR